MADISASTTPTLDAASRKRLAYLDREIAKLEPKIDLEFDMYRKGLTSFTKRRDTLAALKAERRHLAS